MSYIEIRGIRYGEGWQENSPLVKVYIKRYDLIALDEREKMISWCRDTLTEDCWVDGNTFYFRNEKDYLLFALRWA